MEIGWKSGACAHFALKIIKATPAGNTKTREHVKIKAKKLPFFKCGKELKERVDK